MAPASLADVVAKPRTGGQWKGPVWLGMQPRNIRSRVGVARPPTEAELGMGIRPGSGLAMLLAKLQRPERRLVLAAVQASSPRRKARLTREANRRLRALGIE